MTEELGNTVGRNSGASCATRRRGLRVASHDYPPKLREERRGTLIRPALFAIAVLAGAVLSSPASAQQIAGEQLYVPPPAGWKVAYTNKQDNIEVTEVVPAGQNVQDWTEMLTVQVLLDKPVKSPEDILKEQMADFQKECDDVGAGPIGPERENGYDTALRAIACTRSKQWGKGELSLYKVLRGRDRTYIVSRTWRGEPFDKERLPVSPDVTKQWLLFMHQVVLCDSRDVQRPCPAPPKQK
jgi:hypothetical protein